MHNPLVSCPLTGLSTINSITTENYFEYSININNRVFRLKVSLDNGWEIGQWVKPEFKFIFKAMFYNGEWPIEMETIITPDLIPQIIRFGEYPRTFEEKLNHYLLITSLEGGKEYGDITYNINDTSKIYSNSTEEFQNVIRGLASKEYITTSNIPNHNTFIFTEKGIEKANELFNRIIEKEPKKINSRTNRPVISIYGVKEDEIFYDKLRKLFLDYGFTVTGDIINNHTRVNFNNSQDDFAVFLHSSNSDKNSTYVSLVSTAIAFHDSSKEKSHFNYLLFPFLNLIEVPSYLMDYTEMLLDFRLVTNRKNIIKFILSDLDKRTKFKMEEAIKPISNNSSDKIRQYNFPKIEINKIDLIWLKYVYDRFTPGKEESHYNYFPTLWKDSTLPRDFKPMSVNPLLMDGGSYLTVFGIWNIDPASKYIKGAEDVIKAIKSLLEEEGRPNEIESKAIHQRLPEYTEEEIFAFTELVNRFRAFFESFRTTGDRLNFTLQIHKDSQLDLFKYFITIEDAFKKIYAKELKIDDIKEEKKLLNKEIDLDSIHAYQTNFNYRDKNVNPVLGVEELSSELSKLINTLPSEKGQMIGIFGRWGRGKTYLLNELWKKLEKHNEPKYIKIDYHAWKYQETPASWAYLYELFVEDYLGKKEDLTSFLKYYWRLIKLNFKRLGTLSITKIILSILITVLASIFIGNFLSKQDLYLQFGGISVVILGGITYLKSLYKEYSTKATDLIKKYTYRHSFKETMGIQADIQNELINLLKTWIPKKELKKKRIILIVEDIDRCNEQKIIENIDALRILLEDEEISQRVVIVTAIDERILKNAIRSKYNNMIPKIKENFSNHLSLKELVSEYLDKAFISAIKLGELTTFQKMEYLNALMNEDIDEDTKKEIKKEEEKKVNKEVLGQLPILESFKEHIENSEEFAQLKSMFQEQERISEEVGEELLDVFIENGDFKLQGGDIALKDSKGNAVSMPELEQKVKSRIEKQNQFKNLTAKEILTFRNIISSWSEATPRRIRIYYYRFLLCKNLLINKYLSLNKVCPWQNEEYIEILMSEILQHTKSHDSSGISKEKVDLISKMNIDSSSTIEKGKGLIRKSDYLILLEILELTIPY
jgi:hypothetical protein